MDSAPVPNVAFAGSACFQCFKASPSLAKCSSCRIVKYCSQECSAKDWKDHKSFCRSLQAIRSTLSPPAPFSSSEPQAIRQRRQIQRKTWLTEDELLETALKRQATMLESKLLWREPRCSVCWDREYDVEKRAGKDSGVKSTWKVCKGCRVVGFCGKEHEDLGEKAHRETRDAEGRNQCESIQLSNEIDEFFLRRHLASPTTSPSLWVPNRILSSSQPPPSSWSEYLSSVSSFLPSPTPPLAEVYGVFLEALSPVLTILSALQRLDYPESSTKVTLYLIDESLETCSNWIPCLEELQHQLPSLQHLELVTVSPLPSATDSSKSTQLSSVTKLPLCPHCIERGRSRTITHLPSLPSQLAQHSLAISFNSSIALSTDLSSNPTTFWSRTLETLFSSEQKERVPLLLTSQTKEEAKDTMQAFKGIGGGKGLEGVWTVEKNVWKGGHGRVEGWWGLDEEEEDEGEGIVWKNGWWSAVGGRR
ncbi:zinc finger MYND domain-containing protein [Sporobolomyces salmoneus]|uniref:zinc finger MYND domain-containing protein n=1 Tax=Sporobolomyces salmoneus TaxID=183962 RepID=UPI003175061E